MATSQQQLEAVEVAIGALISGTRLAEARDGDYWAKYATLTLAELKAERARLLAEVNTTTPRLRSLIYRGH